MKNIVLLGGNGYIGRAFTEKWLEKDSEATFYVLSRSGKNKLEKENIKNFAVDVTNFDEVKNVLPEKVDIIVDFVGRPANNVVELIEVNRKPAEVMRKVAEEYNTEAMGFIGGKLGPKSFLNIKKDLIAELSQSTVRLEVVEPTVVYGRDRNDTLSKLTPLFKFLGIFVSNMKPVHVDDVVLELVTKIQK